MSNKNVKQLKKQEGNSSIQTAIALMVGVILLIGAIGAYQYITQAKVNNDIAELSDLKNSTVRYGQSVGTFTATNDTIAILTSLNFFPSPRVTGSGTAGAAVTNQWGGTIVPSLGTVNTAGDSLVFTYTGVPTSACRELVTKMDNIATAVSVNATATKLAGAATVAATAIPLCLAGDNQTIAYTMSR